MDKKNAAYTFRNNEFPGDFSLWLRANAEDNEERLERLRRGLRTARAEELTARQRQLLRMRFEEEKSVSQIAAELSLDISTVSRTISRAKEKLNRFLRYAL